MTTSVASLVSLHRATPHRSGRPRPSEIVAIFDSPASRFESRSSRFRRKARRGASQCPSGPRIRGTARHTRVPASRHLPGEAACFREASRLGPSGLRTSRMTSLEATCLRDFAFALAHKKYLTQVVPQTKDGRSELDSGARRGIRSGNLCGPIWPLRRDSASGKPACQVRNDTQLGLLNVFGVMFAEPLGRPSTGRHCVEDLWTLNRGR